MERLWRRVQGIEKFYKYRNLKRLCNATTTIKLGVRLLCFEVHYGYLYKKKPTPSNMWKVSYLTFINVYFNIFINVILLYLKCHNMDLICDWLQDKDLQFIQSEALHVRNMLYFGIFEVFVPKKGQQSG